MAPRVSSVVGLRTLAFVSGAALWSSAMADGFGPLSDYIPIPGGRQVAAMPTVSGADLIVVTPGSYMASGVNTQPNVTPFFSMPTGTRTRFFEVVGNLGSFDNDSFVGGSVRAVFQGFKDRWAIVRASGWQRDQGPSTDLVGSVSIASQALKDHSPFQVVVGAGVADGAGLQTTWHASATILQRIGESQARRDAKSGGGPLRGLDATLGDTWASLEGTYADTSGSGGQRDGIFVARLNSAFAQTHSAPVVIEFAYVWPSKLLAESDFRFTVRAPVTGNVRSGRYGFLEVSASARNRYAIGLGYRF